MFSDPLLRISAVADRIREAERFIADGFRRHEFLALHELLMFDWMMESMKRAKPREWAEITKSEDARKGAEEYQQKRRVWEGKHGTFRNGLKTWIGFLKECEERISAIPSAFSGLGVDPVLADFLKDERRGGWVRVNARPELLPTLAKIGTDHWLARFEDLRYRLEWIDRYWTDPVGIPLIPELEARETLISGERPSLLHFRHEFLRAVGATFAHVFHGLANGVIHSQCLADFGEQRGIIRQFIDESVDLLFQRHAANGARPRISPQPRISYDKKDKHRCALGVCPHAAPTIFNRTKTMNTKDLIRLGVPVGEPIQLAHEFIQNFIAQGNDGAPAASTNAK